jgi:broad specificity phosphatase PhoE
MKTIYLVRHGQSEGNLAPAFQAPSSPLSAHGKEQADKIAERVRTLGCEAIIVSPYVRTRETAEAITQVTGMLPEYSELFVERIKPTSIDGKLLSDTVASAVGDAWNESLYTPNMRVEDGECYDDIIVRADKALRFLEERQESSLLVVTHGFFLRTLVARILFGGELTPALFKRFHEVVSVQNTGISVCTFNPEKHPETPWHVKILNDHAHLG